MLHAWGDGDVSARDELLVAVYDQLHRIARYQIRRERDGLTLQTTDLVNEAYLKLDEQAVSWDSREHFFAIATRLMRQVLVDRARARHRLKRGENPQRVSLSAAEDAHDESDDLLALNEALETLGEVDPQRSQIVELRFFGGLTIEETAEVMHVSTPTVERVWRAARAWLQTELALT